MQTSTTCRVCSSETEDILSLGEQQISDFPKPGEPEPPTFPLDLAKCQNCHLVQLKNIAPPELLYHENYSFKSGISQTIKDDLKEIVEKGLEVVPWAYRVLDIGANDGTLLSNYPVKRLPNDPNGPREFKKFAVEPIKKFWEELSNQASVAGDYWPVKSSRMDIVTLVSVFYDMPNPNDAVQSLKEALSHRGVIIIQQNYLPFMLERNTFDNISHEHLSYYSLTSLEYLLNKYGLEVFRVETNDINGGCFRCFISHKGEREVEPSVVKMRESEQNLTTLRPYKQFAARVSGVKNELLDLVRNIPTGSRIYAYGASTRGSVILQASGVTKYLDAVVERNPDKVGRTYLGIPIVSEEETRKNPPDYGLILPYFFSPELIKRERDAGNTAKFIIPLPEPKIV